MNVLPFYQWAGKAVFEPRCWNWSKQTHRKGVIVDQSLRIVECYARFEDLDQ